MKLVTAIIKPFKLDDVREALQDMDVHGLTITEAKGFGRQKGHKEIYRGAEYTIEFLPKIRLEMVITESKVEQAIEVITEAAKTGQIGDGKIFISPIEHSVRIRTCETGKAAL